jgi:hypothetical protein
MTLVNLPHYTSRFFRETVEINLHQNFNREVAYHLSPAWKEIVPKIKQQRRSHEYSHPPTSNPVSERGKVAVSGQGNSLPATNGQPVTHPLPLYRAILFFRRLPSCT